MVGKRGRDKKTIVISDSRQIVSPKENCGTDQTTPFLAQLQSFRKISGRTTAISSLLTRGVSSCQIVFRHFHTPLVIPAKAGIHGGLDPRVREDDGFKRAWQTDFYTSFPTTVWSSAKIARVQSFTRHY
jgi:hypothetical protein